VAARENSSSKIAAATFDRGSGVPGRVWATRQPLWLRDLESDPELLRAEPAVVGIRNVIAVPVQVGEHFDGVLQFSRDHPCDLDPGLLAICAAGGHQLGQFIERTQAEANLRAHARDALFQADVAVALTERLPLQESLQLCTESMVRHLDAAFARVWTLNFSEQMLELKASAGMYTHLDGPHGRVPVGKFKIGLIAQEGVPRLTNDVLSAPRVGDKDWARREGMVSFAGHPLIVGGQVIGVMAMFARKPLAENTLNAIAAAANAIAVGIMRQRTEDQLRASSERIRAIVDNAADGIITIDERGTVQSFNRAASRLFGYTAHEVVAHNVSMLMPAPHASAHDGYLRNYLRTGHAKVIGVGSEVEGRRKDGTTFPIELSIAEIRHQSGRIFTGILRDISERKAAERQHAELLAQIQGATRNSPTSPTSSPTTSRPPSVPSARSRTGSMPTTATKSVPRAASSSPSSPDA
jgi:PAS domain S-box-containing protein